MLEQSYTTGCEEVNNSGVPAQRPREKLPVEGVASRGAPLAERGRGALQGFVMLDRRARFGLTDLGAPIATLAAGGVGWALFAFLGAPLPALIGPMLAAAALRFAWRPAAVPTTLREAGIFILGLGIGSALTPESVARLSAAPVAALGLVVATVAAAGAGYVVYRGVARWSAQTAFLASVPGAFSTVLALSLSRASDADAARITLAHALRLGVLTLAFAFAFDTGGAALASAPVWSWGEAALAVGLAAGAGLLLYRAKVPAPWILGPSVVVALLTATGIVSGAPHPLVMPIGLWLVGSASGVRIGATPPAAWRSVTVAAIFALVGMGIASAAVAWGAAELTGLPFAVMLLAFAPGGFEATIAIALAYDLDPALVAAANVLRLIGLTVVVPFAFRLVTPPPTEAGDGA